MGMCLVGGFWILGVCRLEVKAKELTRIGLKDAQRIVLNRPNYRPERRKSLQSDELYWFVQMCLSVICQLRVLLAMEPLE